MNILNKEWLQTTIAGIEALRDEMPFGLNEDESNTLIALKKGTRLAGSKTNRRFPHYRAAS